MYVSKCFLLSKWVCICSHFYIFLNHFHMNLCICWKGIPQSVGSAPSLELEAHWAPTRYSVIHLSELDNLMVSFCWEKVLHGSFVYIYNLQAEALYSILWMLVQWTTALKIEVVSFQSKGQIHLLSSIIKIRSASETKFGQVCLQRITKDSCSLSSGSSVMMQTLRMCSIHLGCSTLSLVDLGPTSIKTSMELILFTVLWVAKSFVLPQTPEVLCLPWASLKQAGWLVSLQVG